MIRIDNDALSKVDAIRNRPPGPEDDPDILGALAEKIRARRRELYDSGELVDASTLCERLSLDAEEIEDALERRCFFYVEGDAGDRWFPAFFAGEDRFAIEHVSRALGDLSGPAKYQFFTIAKHLLDGKTALAKIARGEVACVLRAAAEFRAPATISPVSFSMLILDSRMRF